MVFGLAKWRMPSLGALIMHILRDHEVKICQIFFARAFGARDLTLCTEARLKTEEAAKHLHERALAN